MADIVGSMFFSQKTGSRMSGWTENVYILNASNIQAALETLNVTLAPVRASLLGAGVLLPYIRTSDRLIYRDSQVSGGPPGPVPVRPALPRPPIRAAIPSAGSSSLPPVGTPQDWIYDNELRAEALAGGNVSDLRCDMPWSGLVLRCEGGTTFQQRRSMIIRGLPDYVIQSGTDFPGEGRWADNLKEYIRVLLSGPFGFRTQDLSPANPVIQITAINTTTATPVITVAPPPPPAGGGGAPPIPTVGASVRITGNKMSDQFGIPTNINGLWTVLTSPAPNQFTFKNMLVTSTNQNVLQMGGMRIRRYVVLPFNKIIMRRWGKRPVGIPFDPYRGRSKAR
jgi:hypothetical protein